MTAAEALTVPALAGFPHGFFTRRGGVSSGPFAALNCSLSSADDPDAVATNRARAMASLGLPVAALHGVHQVHGVAVAQVTDGWAPGAGPRADALVTNRPGVALGIVTGDCAPVLFADPVAGVVGAAHAGWRGALAGVLEATLDAMIGLGAQTDRSIAAVGPCIGAASYEVAADLRDAVLARDPADARHFAEGAREGRWWFDLGGYCAQRLRVAGIGTVNVVGADTMGDETRFFSHRRRTLRGEGPIGHQLSAIALQP